jgi:hypothetical protein
MTGLFKGAFPEKLVDRYADFLQCVRERDHRQSPMAAMR